MNAQLFKVILLFLVTSVMINCGGVEIGESDGSDSNVNRWVTIEPVNVSVSSGTMRLSGKAFVSSDNVAFTCGGFACLFSWFDDSYPGVDVSWNNLTTGARGAATSKYGTLTGWEHFWSATVSLAAGINEIRITAADPAGNTAAADVTVEYVPPAPNDLSANTGDDQITLDWSPVLEATAYRLYWSLTHGVAFPHGTAIDVVAPPFLHTPLAIGTTYYYVITSLHQGRESAPSTEIQATAGAPSRPVNIAASLIGLDIELSWDTVATASTYTLYWANEAGVTKKDGIQISSVISPYIHTGLSGMPYYFFVTAVNGYGESLESEEVTAFPQIAPPAPDGLKVSQSYSIVDVEWQLVPGANVYNVYRCHAWAISTPDVYEPSPNNCYGPWEHIGTINGDTNLADYTVDTVCYWYYVTASNAYGNSLPSDWKGLCIY